MQILFTFWNPQKPKIRGNPKKQHPNPTGIWLLTPDYITTPLPSTTLIFLCLELDWFGVSFFPLFKSSWIAWDFDIIFFLLATSFSISFMTKKFLNATSTIRRILCFVSKKERINDIRGLWRKNIPKKTTPLGIGFYPQKDHLKKIIIIIENQMRFLYCVSISQNSHS